VTILDFLLFFYKITLKSLKLINQKRFLEYRIKTKQKKSRIKFSIQKISNNNMLLFNNYILVKVEIYADEERFL